MRNLNPLLSSLTVAAVGLTSKAFLRVACASVTVQGLSFLRDALDDRQRKAGILTVANHISVLDDPLVWGILPTRHFLASRTTRWTLGASDIMFTNPVFSSFFRNGQVLETFRGNGIWQDSVDTAIRILDSGGWIHIFPEGKVNQVLSPQAQLLRFKWGIGRLLMDTQRTPLTIPMWLSGFDNIMPENRGFPRFIPRMWKDLSVTFGDPTRLTTQVDQLKQQRLDVHADSPSSLDPQAAMRVRLTRMVQEEVESLGFSVLSRPS